MEVLQRTSNMTKYHQIVNRASVPEKGKVHVVFSRTYRMKYIGCGVLDRCFTQPMLSWIVADIKRRGMKDAEHVVLEVSTSFLKATNVTSGQVILEHKFENICKFTHLPHDKTCFTYLTRDVLEAPFMCHVYHAMDEAMVLELFATMRDMTKGVAPLLRTSFGVDAFAPGSQHFEVLFVGKIKVSQKRAPLSFVDEALEKFRQAEVERSTQARRRHGSGSSLSSTPVPGYSGPSSPTGTPDSTGSRTPTIIPENQLLMQMQRQDTGSSASVELGHGLEELQTVPAGCRLGSTEILSPASPEGSYNSLVTRASSMDSGAKESILNDLTHNNNNTLPDQQTQSEQQQQQTINALMPPAFVTHSQSLDTTGKNSLLQDLLLSSERQQRVRSCSGDIPRACKQTSLPVYGRSRVGSGGPLDMKRPKRNQDSTGSGDQTHLSRAMLLLIGKLDLCLIGTDMKQVMLSKTFSDISHCCKCMATKARCSCVKHTYTTLVPGFLRILNAGLASELNAENRLPDFTEGVQHPDNFGFICREVSLTQKDSYVGYIFRCQTKQVVDEIMQTLKQAFNSAHQAYQRQQSIRGQLHLCDTCPMHWFHRLCVDLEGLPPDKMHLIILRRMKSLSEAEQEDVMLKYQGAEVSSTQEQNEIFMMLLRGLCEHKQVRHAHTPSEHKPENTGNDKKTTASKLDSLKQKARKSISSSFDSIMKRRSKEDLREKCLSDSDGLARTGSVDGDSPDTSPAHSPGKREGSCDFPDRRGSSPPLTRPRSSTFGSASDVKKNRTNGNDTNKSPIMNIFMKVGSSTRGVEVNPSNSNANKQATPSKKGPWRQAIFRRVQAPIQNALRPTEGRQCAPSGGSTRNIPRSPSELRRLWKKAIMEQILLIRMEKENSKLQRNQDAASYKRMKLDYDEITPCLKEDSQKWNALLLGSSRPYFDCDVKELKEMTRQGVPRHERGEIWQFLAEQYCVHHPVTTSSPDGSDTPYSHLLKRLTPHQHAILIDLGRTFPSHPYFAQSLGPGQLSLFNLLKAYSLLDPEVGYCQGLSFVAGVLLLHMSEEHSFHLLKHIHFRMGFRKQYRPDMVALQVQMYQLSRLIHDLYPEIHSHFEQYEVAPTLYAAPWFLTLFASQFPLGFVSRLFDVLFLSGMEAVFKVALVLLGEHQEAILDCPGFESVMEFLKTNLPAMSIIQMERVFSQVFALEIGSQLQAYEVEYNLLQEELQYAAPGAPCSAPVSNKGPDPEALAKLEAANRNLKRQNMELNEQLQVAQSTAFNLETSLDTYRSTVKHLETRVRSLEDERDGLLHSVNALRKRLERMERHSLSSEGGDRTLDLAPLIVTGQEGSGQSLVTLVRRMTEEHQEENENQVREEDEE